MPPHSTSASISTLAFEAFVQVALNGVVLAQVGATLQDDDPTFGLPFSLALNEAQPGAAKRLAALAAAVKQQVSQVALKMAPPAPAEA